MSSNESDTAFIPLDVVDTAASQAFTTQDWLAHLSERTWPAQPPARPIAPFVPRNFSQALNLAKLAAGLGLSLLLRRPFAWGNPVTAMIEPTSLCNLKCPLCPSGNGSLQRTRARIDYEQFKAVIDRLPDSVRMLKLWNQGEPFLVKELPKMISYAKRRGMYVVTSTNGHYFRKEAYVREVIESGIDEIIVSLDGADQEVYATYRVGGQLPWVFEGVQRLMRLRHELGSRTPLVHLQFILMRQNLHQREDMIELGRRLGADRLSFKTLQVTDFEGGEDFLPDDESLTRYAHRTEDGTYHTRKRRFFADECIRLWFDVVVNCDGRVSPCCFDKDVDYPMGDLINTPFEEIWRGETYQRFRQHLLDARYDLDMCNDCTEGMKQVYLQTIDYHAE